MAEITIRVSDKALKIGPIVLGAIALSWAAWYLQSIGAFTPKYDLRMFVPEADGLVTGAPVLLDDVRVESVREIQLAQAVTDTRRNELFLRIEKRYADVILSDAVGHLATQGFLGERVVSIRRGFKGAPLKPGDAINFAPPPPSEFSRVADRLADALRSQGETAQTKSNPADKPPTASPKPH